MLCFGCLPVTRRRDVPGRLGISRRAVARLVAEGVLVALDRFLVVGGCLVERARQDAPLAHRIRLDALLATYPDCVASHESAAVVHDLPVFELPSFAVATRARGAWRGGDERRIRIAPLPPEHVAQLGATLVTTMPRTVVDVARVASMRSAVVVGDAALRRGIPRPALLGMLEEVARWSEVGPARRAIDFLDDRAESPLESLSRVIMHEYGVPPPEPQYEIELDGVTYRVDFYWKERRLIGEADGKMKYAGVLDPGVSPEEVTWREKLREDALRDADYRFVRWTWGQMLGATDQTIARILRRLNG